MSGRTKRLVLAALGLWFGLPAASAQPPSPAATTTRAKGTFDVKLVPVPVDAKTTLASARLTVDKVYQGDLVGSAKGEMWSVETNVKGSAGYVAIEKFGGTLRGKSGGFTLLHHGTMKAGGEFKLTIAVVPDSGTGELTGLRGSMAIVIADGKHFYEFDFTLPEKP